MPCSSGVSGSGPISPRKASKSKASVGDGKAGHSITVTQSGEIRDALEEAYEIGGPAVIDAKVDPEAAYPDVSDRAPP